jgi:pyruvate,water dikinase
VELTKNFKQLNKDDVSIAGGKGASLGEMTRAGINVSGGFVVLAAAFERFMEETGAGKKINAIFDKINSDENYSVVAASERIRKQILKAEIPEDIAKTIIQSFDDLGAEFVAVRSSATAEDGHDHAWAGQLESYLNITKGDVLDKVKLCWSSLFTPRAIFYRMEKGLRGVKISVAVVIQKMVESEISGIAFSVHPITEDRNQLVIEAGFGLGEAIVSGSITPDSYAVSKDPLQVLKTDISMKDQGLYRSQKSSAKGNNEWLAIPEPLASSPALDEKQILELAGFIIGIERHFGFPCDIEWAYEAGKFYILQCRPITTLANK